MKPKTEFSGDKRRPDGLHQYCRDCLSEYNKNYRSTTKAKEIRRKREYKNKYSITIEEFDSLLSSQGSCCAICKTTIPGGTGTWHVDHDHVTKEVRGILCHNCNRGLGFFNDDIKRLKDAALYLELN